MQRRLRRIKSRSRGVLRELIYGGRLFFRASPRRAWAIVLLQAVQAVLPLAGLLVLRRLIDSLAAALAAADPAAAMAPVFADTLMIGALLFAGVVAQATTSLISQRHGMTLNESVQDALHDKAIALDLAAFETPEYHDRLRLAVSEGTRRPASVAQNLSGLTAGLISAVAVGSLIAAFDVRVLGVLVVIGLPGLILRTRQSTNLFKWRKRRAESERRNWLLSFMMTDLAYAKEVRIFGLGDYLKGVYRGLRRDLRAEALALARSRAIADVSGQLLTAAAVIGVLLLIVYDAGTGAITLGTTIMYYGALQRGLAASSQIRSALAGLYEDSLFLESLRAFLAMQPSLIEASAPVDMPRSMRSGIVFERVSFTYPGSERPALCEVSFELRPGEVIALVGPNGAGKSTILKLLCRLYDPDAGRILLEDKDLRGHRLADVRRLVTAVFQELSHFPLSVRDNIVFGDIARRGEEAAMVKAAQAAGIHELVESLPARYDTQLGKWFSDGEELSAGQWQKIALARAYFRDAPVLLLDEPTSALDATAESDFFARVRGLAAGRPMLIVSHRLASVRKADRIYVVDKGRVIQKGSHEELIAAGGLYSAMFGAQASRYS